MLTLMDRKLRWLIVVVLLMMGECTAHALDPRYRLSQYAHSAWRLKDGIFPGTPNSIAQTTDGYVWIGTTAGLLKFDGVSFTGLDNEQAGKFPLGSLAVKDLIGTRDGKLWAGTNTGVIGLRDGLVTDVINDTAEVSRMFQDREGFIWVTRERMGNYNAGPLCRVDGARLLCFGAEAGFPITAARGIIQDTNGDLVVAVPGGVVRFNKGRIHIDTLKDVVIGDDAWVVEDVALDDSDHPIIAVDHSGKKGGLLTLVNGTWLPWTVSGADFSTLHATRLLRDRAGALWIGTSDRGVYRVSGTRVDHFTQADGLSGNTIEQIMEDREGNVWIVTATGVDNFRPTPVVQFGTSEGLKSDGIQAVTSAKDGGVWVATGISLDHLQGDSVTSTTAKNGLPGEDAEALFVDGRGRLWIGVSGSLFIYDKGSFRLVERTKGKQAVNAIAEDSSGDIWVSFSGPTGSLARIHNGHLQQEFLPPDMPALFSVVSDANGSIWVNTVKRLWLHWVNGRWDQIKLDRLDSPSRKMSNAYNMVADREGMVWGLTKHGVVGYKDGTLRLLTTSNGLPCDFTYSAAVDAHDALWVFSQCGLTHIRRSELDRWWQHPESQLLVEHFSQEDGVQPGAPLLRPPVAKTADGRLWFSNGSTLQVVDPDHLTNANSAPPVQLVRAVIDGKAAKAQSAITVPPAARDIEIDYTALSFTMPQRVRFKYQLRGYDGDWQQPGTRRSAFYSNVKPGKYMFQVIAANEAGIWSPNGSSIEVIVEPAWYQTNSFIVVCVLISGAILYGVYRLRVRHLGERLQLQYETRLEERTRVARDLHDTLLQTIQGTKLVAEEALHRSDDLVQLHNVVAKIHEWLSRAVIEGRAALTALRIGSNAEDLAVKLRGAAEECSRHSGMEIKFETVGIPIELSSDVMEEVFRIGYEAIRNACAHSQGSTLQVQIIYAKALKLTVKDNGIGFEVHGTSGRASGHYGLDGMRERAKQLGALLSVSSKVGIGTEVILTTRSIK
jgi:signal transduction histidine kinase/ligand-binding sensor domain-containing protein